MGALLVGVADPLDGNALAARAFPTELVPDEDAGSVLGDGSYGSG
jgi:hypothetical protein